MPSDGRIGFQTNGLLLTDIRMRDLVQAGLDRISFSVDAMELDFALVPHMLAYDENMKDQSVFDRTTDEAIAHYREWCRKAEIEGLNPGEYYGVLWKYIKTGGE